MRLMLFDQGRFQDQRFQFVAADKIVEKSAILAIIARTFGVP